MQSRKKQKDINCATNNHVQIRNSEQKKQRWNDKTQNPKQLHDQAVPESDDPPCCYHAPEKRGNKLQTIPPEETQKDKKDPKNNKGNLPTSATYDGTNYGWMHEMKNEPN